MYPELVMWNVNTVVFMEAVSITEKPAETPV